MSRPSRVTVVGRPSARGLIRADRDRFIRGLYAQLGPVEFWRRRLEWLAKNGKRTSHARLVDYLRRAGIEIPIRPDARGTPAVNPSP